MRSNIVHHEDCSAYRSAFKRGNAGHWNWPDEHFDSLSAVYAELPAWLRECQRCCPFLGHREARS
jgi:hypothetical protein